MAGMPPSSGVRGVPPLFASTPLVRDLGRQALRAFQASLNAPVVDIDGLPPGPAVAGIAVHPAGEEPGVTLVIRNLRTGRVACFQPEAEWSDRHGDDWAVEAALSFAESLGFLFDDEGLRRSDESEALGRRWLEFLAEPEFAESDSGEVPAADAQDEEEAGEEMLWLDEVDSLPPLSKFRFVRSVAAQGRLMKSSEREPQRASELWLRLLSRF